MAFHTPHDTRHTFAMLCDKYDVKENDKKRMPGHAFFVVTNSVYGHRIGLTESYLFGHPYEFSIIMCLGKQVKCLLCCLLRLQ